MSEIDRNKFFSKKLEEQRDLLRAAIVAMAAGDLIQAQTVVAIFGT